MGIGPTGDSYDGFFPQPPSYDGSSENTSNGYPQASSSVGSSMNTRYQPFSSLDQVVFVAKKRGLESSRLIFGIDFTKGIEWTDKLSLERKSLHHIGNSPNLYEQAISITGHTFSSFDEDNRIPCFGFGDASTRDQDVFSFNLDDRYCCGFEEVLARYREIVPLVKLSEKVRSSSVGPTSFAPVIDAAIDIVRRSNAQYHVLVIISDGQVTRNSGTSHGKLSPQEQATINSIVTASRYPLSIVFVGVGDGPWDEMQHFNRNITHRLFDNFQFVNFTKIMSENREASKQETEFALAALMEIPKQYCCFLTAIMEMAYQDRMVQSLQVANQEYQPKRPLPPPKEVTDHDNAMLVLERIAIQLGEPTALSVNESRCPICLANPKDMAFGCGHRTCQECGPILEECPLCRRPVTSRIKLYN